MKIRSLTLSAISTLAATALATATSFAATPKPQFGSSGALSLVDISVAGTPVIAPLLGVSSGVGAPGYHTHTVLVAQGIDLILPVAAGLAPLSLVIAVPVGKTKAEGFRINGGFEATGYSALRTATASLQSTILGITTSLLNISVTNLATEASHQTTAGGIQSVATTAHAGLITISGLLVGGQLIQLKGAIKPNTVLFSSPLLTITSGETYTSVTPSGQQAISVNGIDIALTNALVLGSVLSGRIFLGTNTAF